MRKLMVLMVIALVTACFISIACTGDAKPNNATDKTGADNADTEQVEKSADAAVEGEKDTAGTDAVEKADEPTEGIEKGDVVSSADGSREGVVSNTAAGTEGNVTTRIEEDGSVTIVDSTGNVIASKSVPGTSETTSETVDGLSATGDQQTPVNAVEEKKEINSRGDINIKNKIAIMKTNFGDIYLFFFDDKAPSHVRNILYLAEKDFYKNVRFHRIKPGFVAQAGIARDDWEEPVPPVKLEVDPTLEARHRRGALSAARTNDPNSATSQFFLVFSEAGTKSLDGKYTVYGQMFKGFDTLDKLEGIKVAPNSRMHGEVSKPMQDVYIVDIVIEDSAPYEAEIAKWKEENGL